MPKFFSMARKGACLILVLGGQAVLKVSRHPWASILTLSCSGFFLLFQLLINERSFSCSWTISIASSPVAFIGILLFDDLMSSIAFGYYSFLLIMVYF